MRFRIKELNNQYFAQVKDYGLMGFICGWRTIGKHVKDFGLYPNNHIEHPMNTREEAIQRVDEYIKLIDRCNTTPNYIYLD